MGCVGQGLRVVFEMPSAAGFKLFAYAHHDTLEQMLAANYFLGLRDYFRPGDLIFCGCTPRTGSTPFRAAEPVTRVTRRFLLMVIRVEPEAVTVRLVQDYGAVEEEPTPVLPVMATSAPATPTGPARERKKTPLRYASSRPRGLRPVRRKRRLP